jgi:uncharacterized damage-inducible protein DinB
MSDKQLPIEHILSLLGAAPSRIAAVTSGLPATLLHTPPADNEWSANEVLAHLRACADMWGSAITTILAEETPTIRAINPRTWIKSTDYLEQPFQLSLEAYTQQRRELIAILQSLPSDSWSRTATVIGAGKPLERTVHFYAQWMATHERPHIKQIAHAVKSLLD